MESSFLGYIRYLRSRRFILHIGAIVGLLTILACTPTQPQPPAAPAAAPTQLAAETPTVTALTQTGDQASASPPVAASPAVSPPVVAASPSARLAPARFAAASPGPPVPAPPSPSPAAAGAPSPVAGPPEHDQQRAFAHVQHLAGSVGARLSGTSGEAAALDYIAEQFRSAGYYTEALPFTFTGNVFTPASIELPETTVEGITLIGSPDGMVVGSLVDVGLGDEDGIAGRDLTGRIAVADRGTISFGDKFDNVRAAGAAGLIVVNTAPSLFIGVLGRVVESPAAGVSRSDAPALDAAAAAGTTVTLTVPSGTPGRGTNILAKPSPDAACEILIGGHLDTVPGVPGANDNASGVANVLELARAFAAEGQTAGLCFAAFSGEESGLHGSEALVRVLQERTNLPRAMVNLDVTGAGDGIEVIGSDGPVATALQAADRLGIAASQSQLPENTGSDHQSFAEAGVPVVYFTSGDFGVIHTPNDTVSRIEPELLDGVGDLAKATIEELQSQLIN